MLRHTQIILWRSSALAALLIGLLGIALPVLPTVPFLILAAWAAGKGWPSLEQRLLSHPKYGRRIREWRENGSVPRSAKIMATLMMFGSAILVQFTIEPLWARIAVPLAMLGVAIWLWKRPEAKA
jgi:uncharacterized membrane protein YbaN (DUF454 family)